MCSVSPSLALGLVRPLTQPSPGWERQSMIGPGWAGDEQARPRANGETLRRIAVVTGTGGVRLLKPVMHANARAYGSGLLVIAAGRTSCSRADVLRDQAGVRRRRLDPDADGRARGALARR